MPQEFPAGVSLASGGSFRVNETTHVPPAFNQCDKRALLTWSAPGAPAWQHHAMSPRYVCSLNRLSFVQAMGKPAHGPVIVTRVNIQHFRENWVLRRQIGDAIISNRYRVPRRAFPEKRGNPYTFERSIKPTQRRRRIGENSEARELQLCDREVWNEERDCEICAACMARNRFAGDDCCPQEVTAAAWCCRT